MTFIWLSKKDIHFNRSILAVFAFINVLNPKILFIWLKIRIFSKHKIDHILILISRFEHGHYLNWYQNNGAAGQWRNENDTIETIKKILSDGF